MLASILHLGNVEIEDGHDNEAQIIASSEKHIDFAATLLDLSPGELKKALLYKSIRDIGSEIEYVFFG